MTTLAFVDCETTALGDLAVPYEIAIIKRNPEEPDVPDGEWLYQVQYGFANLPVGTDPASLNIGGYSTRVGGGVGIDYREHLGETDPELRIAFGPEWTIARSVKRQLDGCVLVGVNVGFDAAVLRRMFLRHGLVRPDEEVWHYTPIDLKSATYGAALTAGIRPALPLSSAELADLSKVEPAPIQDRHTALGDARWAARWWTQLHGMVTPG